MHGIGTEECFLLTSGRKDATYVWRRSSYSGGGGTGGGNCVEVAFGERSVAARDSKAPEDGLLILAPRQWARFVDAVRTGRYTS